MGSGRIAERARLKKIPVDKSITFDPDSHTYRRGSVVIPGVTHILQETRLSPDWSYTDPWYAERGKAVHLAMHYLIKGKLRWDSLDERIVPYVEAGEKFIKDYRVVAAHSEILISNKVWNYCGTCDLYAVANMDEVYSVNGRHPFLGDFKCGSPHESHGYQMAGYSLPLDKSVRRFGIYLREDKTYKIKEYDSFDDFRIFLSAVTVYHHMDH